MPKVWRVLYENRADGHLISADSAIEAAERSERLEAAVVAQWGGSDIGQIVKIEFLGSLGDE